MLYFGLALLFASGFFGGMSVCLRSGSARLAAMQTQREHDVAEIEALRVRVQTAVTDANKAYARLGDALYRLREASL